MVTIFREMGQNEKSDKKVIAEIMMHPKFDANFIQTETGQNYLHKAVWYSRTKICKQLIKMGTSVLKRDNAGLLPLHFACNSHCRNSKILELILEKESDLQIDVVTNQKQSALHHVCLSMGDLQLTNDKIRILLSHKILVNPLCKSNTNALASCLLFKNYEAAEMLLEYGADPNIRYPPDMSNLLQFIAAKGEEKLRFLQLLKRYGVDFNAFNNAGYSMIHYIAHKNDVIQIQWLIELGASVDLKNLQNQVTPLEIAILQGHQEASTLLKQYSKLKPRTLAQLNELKR